MPLSYLREKNPRSFRECKECSGKQEPNKHKNVIERILTLFLVATARCAVSARFQWAE